MTTDEAVAPQPDHVIGQFRRDRLSAALASTHRAGFGPHARVIDGERADAGRQLERAGLRILSDADPAPDALLIVVTAPGRTGIVVGLFERLGADAVYFAGRRAVATPVSRPLASAPDIRIDQREASGAEA